METLNSTHELARIDAISITQSGDDFLKDQILMEELTKQKLELSITHGRTLTKLNCVSRFLNKFLSDFEAAWDNDEKCSSPEIAQDYLSAAKYMRDNFRRINNRIEGVQKWVDNYLPY